MSDQVPPPSDDVGGHAYRLAQASRFLRYCREAGVDPAAVERGEVTPDLTSICGPDGMIRPEPIDFAKAARS